MVLVCAIDKHRTTRLTKHRPWSPHILLVTLTVWCATHMPLSISFSIEPFPTRLVSSHKLAPPSDWRFQIPSSPLYQPCRPWRINPVSFPDQSSRLYSTAPEGDKNEFDPTEPKFDTTNTAVLLVGQSTFILLSVVAAFFLRTPNFGLGSNFSLGPDSFRQGLLATLPLFGLAVALDVLESTFGWAVLQNVSRATQRSVLLLLGPTFRPVLALVVSTALGLVAGVGEEMMFRGVLQTELWKRIVDGDVLASVAAGPTLAAVSISSVIFGALHAITPLYAFLATVASYFFGYLYIYSDLNLAVPIVCHAVYDLGALMWAHYVVTNTLTNEEQRSIWNGEEV